MIHQKLVQKYALNVSYSSVARYIEQLKKKEVFVPLHSALVRDAVSGPCTMVLCPAAGLKALGIEGAV